jgi:uncharacterized protein YfaS (alpha-2-macroglobulin family)
MLVGSALLRGAVCALALVALESRICVVARAQEVSRSAVEIISITPSGSDVLPPTEVVFNFNQPVVPLGRMERSPREIGISFSPPLECQWRWMNTSSLGCRIDDKKGSLPATDYRVKVSAHFDTSVKAALDREREFSFSTSAPKVTTQWFREWKGPGMPVILVSLSQAVVESSLQEHIFFSDPAGRRFDAIFFEPSDDPYTGEAYASPPSEKGLRWFVRPASDLPLGQTFDLKVSPGLVPLLGTKQGSEDRAIITFDTFDTFRFLGIECEDLKGKALSIAHRHTQAESRACDPLKPIYLAFNSPTTKDGVKAGLVSTPDLRGGRTDFDPWEDVSSRSGLNRTHRKTYKYLVSLPFGIKANASYTFSADAAKINDEFGRILSEPFSIQMRASHRSPRWVLDNQVSVLEKDADTQLPVVVNNLRSLKLDYQAVTAATNESGKTLTLEPYQVNDVAYPFPIDIRAILKGRSGIVQGTLRSTPETSEKSKWLFSQVTPFALHVKLGHFNSLVWVSSFASGKAIPDARVSLIENAMTHISASPRELASAKTDERGIAMLAGLSEVDPQLDLVNQWEHSARRMMVKVEKDGDVAFLPVSWDFEVYSNAVYGGSSPRYGHLRSWGTTAQGIYRAGDRIQFALWVRNQNNETLTSAPRGEYSLEVFDPMGKVVFAVPRFELTEFGSYGGEFETKTDAVVGWYTFSLRSSFSKQSWEPLRVLLSEFTPASFKVTAELNGTSFHSGETARLTTQARLHAGGPYADAASRITATVNSLVFESSEPELKGFDFTVLNSTDTSPSRQVYEQELRLDPAGDLITTIDLPELPIAYGALVAESAVRDDRGKFVSSQSRARYFGRDRFVGVRQSDWLLSVGKEASCQGAVVDEDGKLVIGAKYSLSAEYQDVTAVRVKSAGNAYITRYDKNWNAVKTCDLTSGVEPQSCVFTPTKAGLYRFVAKVIDTKGREFRSETSRYATGVGSVVWEAAANTDLSIIPERESYKVGETGKFFIRNPYPGATALFSIERYGVQRSWTQVLSDSATVVELPILKDYIPAVYFSATIVSPRVEKPIENQVDLGKPAFRMGYTKVEVRDQAKELRVEVAATPATVKPGETVKIQLSARSPAGSVIPTQFAVTVLDEAVFDLLRQGRSYFDPYSGMYLLDGLDVRNFNLMKMLVGRQKFERKGANPGGDGGSKLDMRSIKKYVGYWNPALSADSEGKADFSFTAPDNLTKWRVFAVAFGKGDQMGLGEGSLVVTKDTEVRSALPNQTRVGDVFTATFTVMNRTDQIRELTVETVVEGDASLDDRNKPQVHRIHAEPFKRYLVQTRARAVRPGTARFTARASDALGGDALTASVPISQPVALQTAATFGSSEADSVSEPVSFPADIEPNIGSVGVVLSPSVIGALDGAFEYMRDYPYSCWEQKLSKAVMAAHYVAVKAYLPRSFTWPGAKELVAETLSQLSQHQAPNGGICLYAASDERVSPYLSAYTALALTWLAEYGYEVPAAEEEKLQRYLGEVLRKDSFPEFFSPGMRSSARAVALAALSRRGKATLQDLLRYNQVVKVMNLFGKASYLQAAIGLKADSKLISDVLGQILSQGVETAATYSFTEPVEALSERVLDTNMRSQCAVLDSLLSLEQGETDIARRVKEIVPKLVRTITLDRKRKERWENTQENLFCMNALARYASRYERGAPNLDLAVSVGSEQLATLSLKGKNAEAQEVSRSLRETDAGKNESVSVLPKGEGRFYYKAQVSYAPKEFAKSATNAGIDLRREYSVKRGDAWTLLAAPVSIRQGELVKVDLFARLTAPRHFVVVDDPIPGGLEAVNRDLATSSEVDAAQAWFEGASNSFWFDLRDWIDFGASFWSFYHKELRHNSARFYSEYLPAGNYHLSYVAQAIGAGEFVIPPTRAEEMYDADVFGLSAADRLVVLPR